MAEMFSESDAVTQNAFSFQHESNIYLEKAQYKRSNSDVKLCGCKGIRSCAMCESSDKPSEAVKENKQLSVYDFCVGCQAAWNINSNHSCKVLDDFENKKNLSTSKYTRDFANGLYSCDHMCQTSVNFNGVSVIKSFVTEREEESLCTAIYSTDFVSSQSGRMKQDYGPKVNFKKKKLKLVSFTGLPSYSQFLYKRMKERENLADFEPVELCNLEYCKDRGAHIDPHFDDSWLWGERLITLNLLSDSILTFTSDEHPNVEVRVPLPRFSLVVVQGAARHQWKHCISRSDITGKRIAMTFRELSAEFSSGGSRSSEGEELLKLALRFQGCAVGVP